MKKVLAIVLCFIVIFSLNFVRAEDSVLDESVTRVASGIREPELPNSGTQTITKLTTLADRIWKTAITVVQALAVGCVIFAGLRYMYASADRKADIKKGMMYLALGAIFVFATTTVIRFIYSAGSSLL